MKLIIDQSPDTEDVEIHIKCGLIDEELEKLISQIRLYSFSVTAKKGDKIYNLRLGDVCYFESVDNRTFIYTADAVYDCSLRLYELESQLTKTNFVRVSKSCILNLMVLKSVRALLNGRMEAELENGERLIISRHYVDSIKQKLEL